MHAFVHMSTISDRAVSKIARHGRTQVEPGPSTNRPVAIEGRQSCPIAPVGSAVG